MGLGNYSQRSRSIDTYPACPECGFDLPVRGTSHPAGDVYRCERCDIEFTEDAEPGGGA